MCIFCNSGKVETKTHFILECEAFKDSKDRYTNILTASSWDNLFSEEVVDKVGVLIITLNRERAEKQKPVL